MYLIADINGLTGRVWLSFSPRLYQGYASDVDSRYILHNSGLRLLG